MPRSLIGKNSETLSGTSVTYISDKNDQDQFSNFVELARFHWQNILLQLLIILAKQFLFILFIVIIVEGVDKKVCKKTNMPKRVLKIK